MTSEQRVILKSFLLQYYESASQIPPQILIPFAIDVDDADDTDVTEQLLSSRASHRVRLHVPERGELHDFEIMAQNNAREMMVRRILRGGGANADLEAPLRYLEKLMGVEEGSLHRAEAYDISNLGNDDICSGMCVFINGRADKQAYRLFKMKRVTSQDDFASMEETLERRFAHREEGFEYPDLILADGGIGQQCHSRGCARASGYRENQDMRYGQNDRHKTAGIVFEDGRQISFEGRELKDEEISLLRFLTTVQNEVHRFALSYQHRLAGKRNIRYKLENISGIGPAKRKNLLAHFGTIKAVGDASAEVLAGCKGISEENAAAIYKYFHGE